MILKKIIPFFSFLLLLSFTLSAQEKPVKEKVEIDEKALDLNSEIIQAPPPPPPPPPSPEVEEIFQVVEDMPVFKGCEDQPKAERKKCADKKMLEYVYANLEYPKIAKENGVEGTVVISFVVRKDGTLKDIKILRDIGANCGKAAMKVFMDMNEGNTKWNPGMQRGRPVDVRYNFPVKFKLDKSDGPVFHDQEIKIEKRYAAAPPPPPPPPASDVEEIFQVVEVMPMFPGCEDQPKAERKKCADKKMLEYVYANLEYPQLAKENGVEGTVVISFVVQADGALKNIKILRDIGATCGLAAKKVFEDMKAKNIVWNPGKQRGRPVAVNYNIPVRFKLEKKEEPIFKVVEEMPTFPGCETVEDKTQRKACADKKMLEYLYRNLNYPAEARSKGIQGSVLVKFIVRPDGRLTDLAIKSDIGGGCGEATLAVIQKMIDDHVLWNPGKQRGQPVAVEFTMPAVFRLENGASNNSNQVKKKKKKSNKQKD